MPRFRFNWANLPEPILTALARGLSLSGDAASELRRIYGARPKEGFIADTWSTLQRIWLDSDAPARASIAATLRERNVGQPEVVDDSEYLATCRNTVGLRRVVLPVFIAIGEQPRDAMGTAPIEEAVDAANPFGGRNRLGAVPNPGRDDGHAPSDQVSGTDRPSASDGANPVEHLREWVGDVLRRMFDDPGIRPDDDGDFELPRYGSSQLYVSVLEKPLRLEIFSVLLDEVEYSERLMRTLNLINGRLVFEKVRYLPEQKIAVMSSHLHADGLSVNSLGTFIRMAAMAADHFDTHLEEQFGGRKAGDDVRGDEQVI